MLMTVFSLFAAGLLQGAMSNQASEKEQLKTVNWTVSFPFVGCDHGKPVPNAELPDTNGANAICPGKQPPDTLLSDDATESRDANYEVGTIIAVGISREKIVIATDSRTALANRRPDGTIEVVRYDDAACKLTQLTPKLLFAADGQTASTDRTLPANALYDAHKLARLAARNYRPNPSSEEEVLAGGAIEAIAARWAWDVDFRMHRASAAGWKPMQTLEGIFVGLEPNGETTLVVAKLIYPRPRAGFRTPPVEFSIGRLNPPPVDFTWVEAFGMKDVVESYRIPRLAMTEDAKAENKRLAQEVRMDPRSFSPQIPERLVDLTIQHYQAAAGRDGALFVHGPIDVAIIERTKSVKWIRSKECSGAQTKN